MNAFEDVSHAAYRRFQTTALIATGAAGAFVTVIRHSPAASLLRDVARIVVLYVCATR